MTPIERAEQIIRDLESTINAHPEPEYRQRREDAAAMISWGRAVIFASARFRWDKIEEYGRCLTFDPAYEHPEFEGLDGNEFFTKFLTGETNG